MVRACTVPAHGLEWTRAVRAPWRLPSDLKSAVGRYYSPFPKEYADCKILYFCEYDLHFTKKPEALQRYIKRCEPVRLADQCSSPAGCKACMAKRALIHDR